MNGNNQTQSTEITQALHDYITQEIAYERTNLLLSNDFNLIEQGVIDSMGILRVMNFIEEQFGLLLEPGDLLLENFATLAAMTTFIRTRLATANER